MSRTLVMLGIGLVFGGGIGFVTAAGNGITLDGHDHGDHAAHAGAAVHGHDHTATHVVAPGPDAPSLAIAVEPDPMAGWNLNIRTENFRFAPENASRAHRAGEGHAHVYVNGVKIARHYGPWFHIADLPRGENRIAVSLTTNDHRTLAVGDDPLRAVAVVTVP
ncbi:MULTISPECIES: hypothetical protein [unclassified Roseitalea]|uniref:hypothetical protein n=1 Tax=unclassified Roseitalea TaxID=2639107 RepID=UPI00273E4D8E|nr:MULTISPECIES: hypothetical protein [unclassified Roseitalea]